MVPSVGRQAGLFFFQCGGEEEGGGGGGRGREEDNLGTAIQDTGNAEHEEQK